MPQHSFKMDDDYLLLLRFNWPLELESACLELVHFIGFRSHVLEQLLFICAVILRPIAWLGWVLFDQLLIQMVLLLAILVAILHINFNVVAHQLYKAFPLLRSVLVFLLLLLFELVLAWSQHRVSLIQVLAGILWGLDGCRLILWQNVHFGRRIRQHLLVLLKAVVFVALRFEFVEPARGFLGWIFIAGFDTWCERVWLILVVISHSCTESLLYVIFTIAYRIIVDVRAAIRLLKISGRDHTTLAVIAKCSIYIMACDFSSLSGLYLVFIARTVSFLIAACSFVVVISSFYAGHLKILLFFRSSGLDKPTILAGSWNSQDFRWTCFGFLTIMVVLLMRLSCQNDIVLSAMLVA